MPSAQFVVFCFGPAVAPFVPVERRAPPIGLEMVGAEPRTFAYDEMRRLIERKPEFEKLFVARGLRHPQPEVRWRKKP
jgi:hypothetical protein